MFSVHGTEYVLPFHIDEFQTFPGLHDLIVVETCHRNHVCDRIAPYVRTSGPGEPVSILIQKHSRISRISIVRERRHMAVLDLSDHVPSEISCGYYIPLVDVRTEKILGVRVHGSPYPNTVSYERLPIQSWFFLTILWNSYICRASDRRFFSKTEAVRVPVRWQNTSIFELCPCHIRRSWLSPVCSFFRCAVLCTCRIFISSF